MDILEEVKRKGFNMSRNMFVPTEQKLVDITDENRIMQDKNNV